jgi:hypothetical protein
MRRIVSRSSNIPNGNHPLCVCAVELSGLNSGGVTDVLFRPRPGRGGGNDQVRWREAEKLAGRDGGASDWRVAEMLGGSR